MARVVNFEGQSHSFPDDASDDEIRAALSGAPAQRTGLAGVADEITNPSHSFSLMGAAKGLNNTIDAAAQSLQGNFPPAIKSLFNDATGLGNGSIDPSTPEGSLKGAAVAASVLPMSPASTAGRVITQASRAPRAPSIGELATARDADYAAGRASNASITPDAGHALADKITAVLQPHFDPVDFPAVYRAVDRLREPSAGVPDIRVGKLDDVHSALGNLGEVPGNGAAVGRAREPLQNYMENIPPADVARGDAQGASQFFRQGRENAAGAFRSDTIQERLRNAGNNAGASGTHSNEANTVRQGANSLLKTGDFKDGESRLYGFTPEETQAVEGSVQGSRPANAARFVAKKVGSPFLWGSLAGAAGAAAESGHLIPAAVLGTASATSYGARQIADILARRPLQKLDEATRARTPLGQAMPRTPGSSVAVNPQMSPVAAMMLGLGANRNQSQ